MVVLSADADVPGVAGAAMNAAVRYTARQFNDTTNSRSIPDYRDFFQSTDFTVQPDARRTVPVSLSAAF